MNLQCVAVYDKKMGAYNKPFYTRTKGEAIRAFATEIQRPAADNYYYQHTTDYALHILGTFDDETGKHEPNHYPEIIEAITLQQKGE